MSDLGKLRLLWVIPASHWYNSFEPVFNESVTIPPAVSWRRRLGLGCIHLVVGGARRGMDGGKDEGRSLR